MKKILITLIFIFLFCNIGSAGTIYENGNVTFWDINDIETLHTEVNNESLLSYDSNIDTYTMHVPFIQNQTDDLLFIDDNLRIKSNDNDISYIHYNGNLEINNANISAWDTVNNKFQDNNYEERAYIKCINENTLIEGYINNSEFNYLGSNNLNENSNVFYNLTHINDNIIKECIEFNFLKLQNEVKNNKFYNNYTLVNNSITLSIQESNNIKVYNNYIKYDLENSGGNDIALSNVNNSNIYNNTINSTKYYNVYFVDNSFNNTFENNELLRTYKTYKEETTNGRSNSDIQTIMGYYFEGNKIINSDYIHIVLHNFYYNNYFNIINNNNILFKIYDNVDKKYNIKGYPNGTIKKLLYANELSSSHDNIKENIDCKAGFISETSLIVNDNINNEELNLTIHSGEIDYLNMTNVTYGNTYKLYDSSDNLIETTQATDYAKFNTNLLSDTYYVNSENTAPSKPTNIDSLSLLMTDHTPVINFTKGIDPEGEDVLTYVYVGTNNTPTEIEDIVSGNSVEIGNNIILEDNENPYEEQYYVRFRTYDGQKFSDYTVADGFSMNNKPEPVNLYEINGYHDDTQNITLVWDDCPNKDTEWENYYLRVGTSPSGNDTLEKQYSGTDYGTDGMDFLDNYTISQEINVEYPNIYYWSVRVYDGTEYSEWVNSSFGFINEKPYVSGVSISPDPVAVEDNLLASYDVLGDNDGDTTSVYYKWYKNGILQEELNSNTVDSSYTSNDEIWKVGIIPNDTFENGSEVQSQSVQIGSLNSAPNLDGININKNYPIKPNTDFNIETINAGDPNSDSYRVEIGTSSGSSDFYIGNYFDNGDINLTFDMNYNDGEIHPLYVRIYDGELSSQEYVYNLESDDSKPIVNNEWLSSSNIEQGNGLDININTTSNNATITNAVVKVSRPDATSQNWTMEFLENDTWKFNYLSTTDVGTYIVDEFYITDDAGYSDTISSGLSFKVYLPETGSGGGGGTVIVNPSEDDSDLKLSINNKVINNIYTMYFYRPFNENKNDSWYYIMDSNHKLDLCRVGDLFNCEILNEGTQVKVSYDIKDDNFISQDIGTELIIIDKFNKVKKVPVNVNIYNLGTYVPTPSLKLGISGSNVDDLFFKSEEGIISGIRIFTFIMLISILISGYYLKKELEK